MKDYKNTQALLKANEPKALRGKYESSNTGSPAGVEGHYRVLAGPLETVLWPGVGDRRTGRRGRGQSAWWMRLEAEERRKEESWTSN